MFTLYGIFFSVCSNFPPLPEYLAEAGPDTNRHPHGEKQQYYQYQRRMPLVAEIIMQRHRFGVPHGKAEQQQKQHDAQEPFQITHDSFSEGAKHTPGHDLDRNTPIAFPIRSSCLSLK